MLGGFHADTEFREDTLTTAIIVIITAIGVTKGLKALEALEQWALYITLLIIVLMASGFAIHDWTMWKSASGIELPTMLDHTPWEVATILRIPGRVLVAPRYGLIELELSNPLHQVDLDQEQVSLVTVRVLDAQITAQFRSSKQRDLQPGRDREAGITRDTSIADVSADSDSKPLPAICRREEEIRRWNANKARAAVSPEATEIDIREEGTAVEGAEELHTRRASARHNRPRARRGAPWPGRERW